MPTLLQHYLNENNTIKKYITSSARRKKISFIFLFSCQDANHVHLIPAFNWSSGLIHAERYNWQKKPNVCINAKMCKLWSTLSHLGPGGSTIQVLGQITGLGSVMKFVWLGVFCIVSRHRDTCFVKFIVIGPVLIYRTNHMIRCNIGFIISENGVGTLWLV